jgi:hypothetical protein
LLLRVEQRDAEHRAVGGDQRQVDAERLIEAGAGLLHHQLDELNDGGDDQDEGQDASRTDLADEAEGIVPRLERSPELKDFYIENDAFTVTNKDRNDYQKYLEDLKDPKDSSPDWRREVLDKAVADDRNYYVLEFSNVGGLVMPIILELGYADGSSERLELPAEIWRRSPERVSRLIMSEREIESFTVDPNWETADVDLYNNHYPRRVLPSRLEVFEPPEEPGDIPHRDLMQDIKAELDSQRRKLDTPDALPAPTGDDADVPLRSPAVDDAER